MSTTLEISSRFNGPPDSANGGYTCGCLANLVGSDCVEVTLRQPPPLDREMEVRRADGSVELWADEVGLVAQACPSELELEVPSPPSWTQTEAAGAQYSGHQDHPFPTCFVCGPGREQRDGLAVFAGPVEGTDLVAAPWIPAPDLGDAEGFVRPEFLWCALDCPGAFAVDQKMETPRVLGRLVGRVQGRLKVGEKVRVIGWSLGTERRKAFAGTALIDSQDTVVAVARAIWIAIGE